MSTRWKGRGLAVLVEERGREGRTLERTRKRGVSEQTSRSKTALVVASQGKVWGRKNSETLEGEAWQGEGLNQEILRGKDPKGDKGHETPLTLKRKAISAEG